MRKMILLICMMLLTCQPLAANPVVISGVGEVELGQDIVMTEGHDKKGDLIFSFRIKDGAVWRAATLMPIKNMPTGKFSDMIKTDVFLNKVIEEAFSKNPEVLSTEKARKVMIGGRESATASVKLFIPGGGVVANTDMTIISGTDGYKLVGYMCADSDTQYWRPIMQKILASIP